MRATVALHDLSCSFVSVGKCCYCPSCIVVVSSLVYVLSSGALIVCLFYLFIWQVGCYLGEARHLVVGPYHCMLALLCCAVLCGVLCCAVLCAVLCWAVRFSALLAAACLEIHFTKCVCVCVCVHVWILEHSISSVPPSGKPHLAIFILRSATFIVKLNLSL